MIGFIVLAVVIGAVTVVRSRATRRARASVAARLTPRPDGMISGAAPIDLPADGHRGVLLLHGFGDTPQTFEYLANYLHGQGWGARAPLLPGHGRTLDAFAASRATDWIDCAQAELGALRRRYEVVTIVGQSMGGALATMLAASSPEVPALVLLAPYLSMPTRLRRAASMHVVLGAVLPYLRGGGERSIRDPREASRNLAYGFTTPRLIFELSKVVARGRSAAASVRAPTLVVQSRQDHRIPLDAAERVYNLFVVPERRLIWTEGNGHVISVDYGRDRVFAAVGDWLESHTTDVVQNSPRLGEPRT